MGSSSLGRIWPAAGEALGCVGTGLRDGLHPRVILRSLAIWGVSLLLWTIVFWLWHGEIHGLFEQLQSRLFGAFRGSAALAWLATTVAFVMAVLLSALLLTELLLMPAIQAVVLRRHPQLARAEGGSWRTALLNNVGHYLLVAAVALPLMLVPVVGVAALFVLFGYVNVRGTVPDALDGVATHEEVRALIRGSRLEMAVLGALATAVMMVPPLTLVGPSVFGATVAQFALRRLAAQRRSG
jgi:hypothetical protein